jgi:hypothetical protein
MSKETINYDIKGSVVVKPSLSGKTGRSFSASNGWVVKDSSTGKLRNSMKHNISSLGKLLNESEKRFIPNTDVVKMSTGDEDVYKSYATTQK